MIICDSFIIDTGKGAFGKVNLCDWKEGAYTRASAPKRTQRSTHDSDDLSSGANPPRPEPTALRSRRTGGRPRGPGSWQ